MDRIGGEYVGRGKGGYTMTESYCGRRIWRWLSGKLTNWKLEPETEVSFGEREKMFI